MLVRLQSSSCALTCTGKVGCVLECCSEASGCTVGLSKHYATAFCQELGAGNMQAEPVESFSCGQAFPVG